MHVYNIHYFIKLKLRLNGSYASYMCVPEPRQYLLARQFR